MAELASQLQDELASVKEDLAYLTEEYNEYVDIHDSYVSIVEVQLIPTVQKLLRLAKKGVEKAGPVDRDLLEYESAEKDLEDILKELD